MEAGESELLPFSPPLPFMRWGGVRTRTRTRGVIGGQGGFALWRGGLWVGGW